ncbi:MAG: hypothetical protein HY579_07770 [Nitrospinae bacterium]|nr:hypothetical protein [Nitrospinota bacterium]
MKKNRLPILLLAALFFSGISAPPARGALSDVDIASLQYDMEKIKRELDALLSEQRETFRIELERLKREIAMIQLEIEEDLKREQNVSAREMENIKEYLSNFKMETERINRDIDRALKDEMTKARAEASASKIDMSAFRNVAEGLNQQNLALAKSNTEAERTRAKSEPAPKPAPIEALAKPALPKKEDFQRLKKSLEKPPARPAPVPTREQIFEAKPREKKKAVQASRKPAAEQVAALKPAVPSPKKEPAPKKVQPPEKPRETPPGKKPEKSVQKPEPAGRAVPKSPATKETEVVSAPGKAPIDLTTAKGIPEPKAPKAPGEISAPPLTPPAIATKSQEIPAKTPASPGEPPSDDRKAPVVSPGEEQETAAKSPRGLPEEAAFKPGRVVVSEEPRRETGPQKALERPAQTPSLSATTALALATPEKTAGQAATAQIVKQTTSETLREDRALLILPPRTPGTPGASPGEEAAGGTPSPEMSEKVKLHREKLSAMSERIKQAKRLVSKSQDPRDDLIVLGKVYLESERYYNSMPPEDRGEFILAGNSDIVLGDYNDALLSFQLALSVNPNDPETLYQIGAIYDELKKGLTARHYMERAKAMSLKRGDSETAVKARNYIESLKKKYNLAHE